MFGLCEEGVENASRRYRGGNSIALLATRYPDGLIQIFRGNSCSQRLHLVFPLATRVLGSITWLVPETHFVFYTGFLPDSITVQI